MAQCTLGKCPQWTKEPLWNVIFGLFYHYDCSLHHKWAEPSRGNVLSAQRTVHSALLPNWRCEAVRRKPPLRCSRKLNLEQFCFCAGRSDGFAGGTVGVWSSEILHSRMAEEVTRVRQFCLEYICRHYKIKQKLPSDVCLSLNFIRCTSRNQVKAEFAQM